MEREEILSVFEADPEAIMSFVTNFIQKFTEIIQEQRKEIALLKERITML